MFLFFFDEVSDNDIFTKNSKFQYISLLEEYFYKMLLK
jgi:hypothetical protein